MSEPVWELLGGGGMVGGAIDYIGTWAAGTTYKAGDVVRYNGVDYLAVNPSLGQTPPTVTPFAPVAVPVVNGQWVKGVGGSAVWAAITGADIKAPVLPKLLFGGYMVSPVNDGGWHKITSDAVISGSAVSASDLLGPAGVYTQYRYLMWFNCSSVGASADYILNVSLGRPAADNNWCMSPDWRPTRAVGISSTDTGWLSIASGSGLNVLTFQYIANYAGGPLAGTFAAACWIR